MAEQRLAEGGLVRDYVSVWVTVPCAEDGVSFFLVRRVLTQPDDCSDGHARRVRIFK